MEQLAFFDIPSPCIGICQSDERGYCKGCMRSREERFGWLNFSNAQKADIIRLCHARKRRRQLAMLKQRQLQQREQTAALNQQLNFDDSVGDVETLDLNDFKLD
ncbi:DUF1289 domain-containing protein [Shewanella dokdonensis]|uniref:DUF1289 domain-containing protein n=1 Tax=Shewanella dokdonensis TaxID=712036 RepID=A0ABX8DGT1_9GAMM|nr:DUF1289 domain-containing protein [Shewanella dokdonensis]MCL1074232.1 DUF1289 domain-containing protein [Shewanella dokdonensis]QVK23942.1 DUF1289 domain-containing protein [Shewanella dokdonensis]